MKKIKNEKQVEKKEQNKIIELGSKKVKTEKGITILILVITIIVLLILAGITISAITGDNGLIQNAGKAKESAEIDSEKEAVETATVEAMGKNKYGNVVRSELQEELNKDLGDGITSVLDGDNEEYIVKFIQSERYYTVNANGDVEYIKVTNGEKILTVQCVDSKNQLLLEYQYMILQDQYSKKAPEIAGYIPHEESITGEITEDTTITFIYYLIFNNDDTLVFTGLDQSGNITTNESQIVSYMVGDGSSTYGNGLKEKEISGVLKIPETYNGKKVTRIGQNAFRENNNIFRVEISDNIERIDLYAFNRANNMESLVIGKNVTNIGNYSFWHCGNLKSVTFKNNNDCWGVTSFGGCGNWTEINIDNTNTAYKVEDNILYSADGKILKLCPRGRTGEFVVPETVEIIDQNAFAYTYSLSSVVITDNVKQINGSAFNSSYISNIKIGKNIENIGLTAFYNCIYLKNITIDSLVIAENLTSGDSCEHLLYFAETIYLKEGIANVGEYITTNYTQTDSDKTGYVKYIK